MTMTMISPFSGVPEQQDLIPLRGNQEFRRRRDLGWTTENQGVAFRRDEGVAKKPQARR